MENQQMDIQISKDGFTTIGFASVDGEAFNIAECPKSTVLDLSIGNDESPLVLSFVTVKELRTRLKAMICKDRSKNLAEVDKNGVEWLLHKDKETGLIEIQVADSYAITMDKDLACNMLGIIDRFLSVGSLPIRQDQWSSTYS